MVPYLLAFLALILFIPVMFVFPLGLNKSGKVFLFGITFLISILGIAAKTVLNIWQIIIIIVLLIGVITYFIENRFGSKIFVKKEAFKESSKKVIKFDLVEDIKDKVFEKNFDEENRYFIKNNKVESNVSIQQLDNELEDLRQEQVSEPESKYELEALIEELELFDHPNQNNELEIGMVEVASTTEHIENNDLEQEESRIQKINF
ncbi:hypothetical protein [Fredinandcohnia quinoae]|uniref:MFS transporter n=1 Tax=Fredinandcohnia quinoae TaxID=2918902 RepID=A0AAW5E0Y2_9BACI|nr:hypothetical protein [Fredinandcohnia sp. SECRCQ15]MCH1626566.1 hypothetical protein [Fredinandcohnia sp. SECRCQ15]